MKLSIVIPIYNEKATLEEIFRLVQATPYDKEIIAVDDASTDGSREILARLAQQYDNVKAFYHQRNQGKGAALRTGFAQVTGDVVIIQDADLEYRPADYPSCWSPSNRTWPTWCTAAAWWAAGPTGSCSSGTTWATGR